jgi:NADH:ubiquinone oxidoreductase subunit C
MKSEVEIVGLLQQQLHRHLLDVSVPRERRIYVVVEKQALHNALTYLVKELKFRHLSMITGVDVEDNVELIYHLVCEGTTSLSLKVVVSKKKLTVPTVTDVIPGASLYEREVHDILGVTFEGHADLSPLILPEKWPREVYPLMKKHSWKQLKEMTTRSIEEK